MMASIPDVSDGLGVDAFQTLGVNGSSMASGNTSTLSYMTGSTTEESYDDGDYLDDYEYDYHESIGHINWSKEAPVAVVYGLTLLLGVIGNSLVIFSIGKYKPMRSITNIFLLSLASADLLLVCVCVPVKCIAFFTFTWELGLFMCKFVHYLQNISMICSVMTLTVMSIERFIAILFPLQAKSVCTPKHAVVLCLLIWMFSLVFAVPILIGQTEVERGERRKGIWCVKEWSLPIYGIVYEMFMLVLLFVIPIVVMIIAYASICRELWLVTSQRRQLRASSEMSTMYYQPAGHSVAPVPRSYAAKRKMKKVSKEDDSIRRQVIQMLVVVVVLFAICWGPILINNLLVAWGILHTLHYGYLKPMRQAFFLMSYMNSCVNPIVYGFMSKNFRERFRHAICRVCGRRNWVAKWCRRRKHPANSKPTRMMGTMSMSRSLSMKTDYETDQTDFRSETVRPIAPFENSSDTT